jgi:hypothetical protein
MEVPACGSRHHRLSEWKDQISKACEQAPGSIWVGDVLRASGLERGVSHPQAAGVSS